MANGPELWDMILAQMPPGSVIAGGAVRDYLLGVEPKDIDVFMGDVALNEAPTQDFYFIEAFDARVGLMRIDDIYERQEEYAALTDIRCVSTGSLFEHRVDLVDLDNFQGGAALVEGFDFGLTRCWYDGQLHDTDWARTDRENKTVTLLLNERRERALTRFARFNERMGGDWTLVENYQ